jgi:hypothetical protein
MVSRHGVNTTLGPAMLGPRPTPPSRGVVYFLGGYHEDTNRSLQYVKAISRSAKKLSETNAGLTISVIKNAFISVTQSMALGFSSIIHIKEEHI